MYSGAVKLIQPCMGLVWGSDQTHGLAPGIGTSTQGLSGAGSSGSICLDKPCVLCALHTAPKL